MDASLDWIWFGPPLEAIADEVTYERADGTNIGATNDGSHCWSPEPPIQLSLLHLGSDAAIVGAIA